jgi:hypothetical protein
MEAAAPVRVSLLGRSHAVVPPPSLIEQEELYLAWQEARAKPKGLRIIRVAAALVGLCTRIGREAGASYPACDCDPLVYGGAVYNWIRTQGPNAVDGLVDAAVAIEPVLARSLLALSEAQKRADFSAPRVEA